MATVVQDKATAKSPAARVKQKVRLTNGNDKSSKSRLVADFRLRLGLNQSMFARLLPVSVRTLATLESGVAPTDAVARRLLELGRLTDALMEVMKQDSLGKWLQTPNQAFEGLKPLEVIDRGEADRIWVMIYFLRSGVPS